MSEQMRIVVEVSFNIAYLLVVWGLVVAMIKRRGSVQPGDRPIAVRLIWAFALLALGDSGHVGLRVYAYAQGGLSANSTLVGLGALTTAFTVTIFYMILVDIWRLRFRQKLGWFGIFLLATGLVRLVVMGFPQNGWDQLVAPYDWSLLRNGFLVIQGLGVMALILRDAARTHDRAFTQLGVMIALSYAFYAPVILWVAQVPLLGMLMIPKTCAYVGVAIIGYNAFFRQSAARSQATAAA
jgi:hypothetical protein